MKLRNGYKFVNTNLFFHGCPIFIIYYYFHGFSVIYTSASAIPFTFSWAKSIIECLDAKLCLVTIMKWNIFPSQKCLNFAFGLNIINKESLPCHLLAGLHCIFKKNKDKWVTTHITRQKSSIYKLRRFYKVLAWRKRLGFWLSYISRFFFSNIKCKPAPKRPFWGKNLYTL